MCCKTRSTKFEIRNNFQILNTNVQNVLNFGYSYFDIVSANFIKSGEIRIYQDWRLIE
jgi:hypothetical protein